MWMFSITEVTFKAETNKQQQHRIWRNNSDMETQRRELETATNMVGLVIKRMLKRINSPNPEFIMCISFN